MGWLLGILALTACASGAPDASAQASVTASTSGDQPAATVCNPIELETPSGMRLDLTGTWGGGSTIHYIRQIGDCVWWEAVSNLPGAPLGAHWRNAFHGSLAPDFTVSGDWAELYNDSSFRQGGPENGWVQLQIVIETVGGEETITLVRGATRGDPYRPESLERIQTPEWPVSPDDPT
jgi:hypothetical protein